MSVQGVSGLFPGGLCPGECLCPGVSLFWGCLCPEGCLSGGFLSRRGLCPGVSLSRGVSVQGASVQRGLCPGGFLSKGGFSVRETPYNKGWVVCILLECNVLNAFKEKIITFHDLHKLDLLAINLKRFSCEYFMMK